MFLTFILSLFLLARSIFATGEFSSTQKSLYELDASGNAKVTHQLSIRNLFPTIYAKEFTLKISSPSLSNIQAYDDHGNILSSNQTNQENTILNLVFSNPSVGKNQEKTFTITYLQPQLANYKGSIWNLVVPQISNDYLQETIATVKTPIAWGELAANSQKPIEKTTDNFYHTTIFKNSGNNNPKISLSFGQTQIFKFDLVYNLSNPTSDTVTKEISLPPDTSLQRIQFQDFSPPPDTIETDINRNWLAKYTLKPQQNLLVKVSGFANIFQNTNYPKPEINQVKAALSTTTAWPTSHPKIQQILPQLKTPKDIYHYVTNTLSYDRSRINNSGKLGIDYLLSHPQQALCTEFTDLFITLSRAKGLASREVIGYAFSNNFETKPLNQNADILHAWPQYYDPITQNWKDVDPTWGKTTEGIDYFTNLDLNHLVFVIHSEDDQNPKPPGAYRSSLNQKTVQVDYAETSPSLTYNRPQISLQSMSLNNLTLQIFNPNHHALYQININAQTIPLLAPLQTVTIKINHQPQLIPEQKLNISYEGQSYTQNIKLLPQIYFELVLTLFGVIILAIFAIITIKRT